jgi:hypothetical protein
VIARDQLATKVPFTCLRDIGGTQTAWGSEQLRVTETVPGTEA